MVPHGNHLRRDLNHLTGERIKPLRVGADCARMRSIDRYGATATVPDSVLRQHEMKGVNTQRDSTPLLTDQKAIRHPTGQHAVRVEHFTTAVMASHQCSSEVQQRGRS